MTAEPRSPLGAVPQGLGRVLLLLVTLSLLATCTDRNAGPGEDLEARFSLATEFPERNGAQASFLDSWRVAVLRPGEGVIAEESGVIEPAQSTISLALTVDLNAPCENLTIRAELSAGGQVWFRSEETAQICSGPSNTAPVLELQFVRPSPSVSPGSLAVTVQERLTATESFTIGYSGSDGLAWSAEVEEGDAGWLTLQPTSGAIQGGTPAVVQARVNAEGLQPGGYSAHIRVLGEGFTEPVARIPVTATVTEGPRLGVSPADLSFTTFPEANPSPQTLLVSNEGAGTLQWTASDDAGWMALAPSSGSLGPGATQAVTVSVNGGGLPLGTYQGTITVTGLGAGGSPKTVPVDLMKVSPPRIGLSTTNLTFLAFPGMEPAPGTFTISNQGGAPLAWTISDDAGWLSLSPTSGILEAGGNQVVTASAEAGTLPQGLHSATITVTATDADNSPRTLAVELNKTSAPRITLSAPSISFVAAEGEDPTNRLITVSNTGGGILNWSVSDDAPWLSVEPVSGALPAGLGEWVTIAATTENLSVGVYSATVTFQDPLAQNSPLALPVTLTVTQAGSAPTISDLGWYQRLLNDPTCGNQGTRFGFNFDYFDPDGDVEIVESTLVGEPIGLRWQFLPEGTSGSASTSGDVEGNGTSGNAGFEMCIAYQVPQNTSIDVTVTLDDGEGRTSNSLTVNIPRPDGANAPPPGAPTGTGDVGVSGKGIR